MPPAVERAAAGVAYNPILMAALRAVQFVTPLILSAVLWVGGNYLASQSAAMAAVTTRVDATEKAGTAMDKRLTSLETQAQLGRADRLAFQDRTDAALAKLADQQTVILQSLAALTARLDQNDRQTRNP